MLLPCINRSLSGIFTLALWLIFFSNSSMADPQSKSFSHWHVNNNTVTATFTVASREATRLPEYQYNPDLAEIFSRHISNTVQVFNQQQACPAEKPINQRAKKGYLQYSLSFHCPQALTDTSLVIRSLMDVAPSHVHFAKLSIENTPPFEKLFTRRQIEHSLNVNTDTNSSDDSNGETLLTYTLFGFEHILIGADHIAFLLTLLLLVTRLRSVIFIVTGFTLGHSITLSLATLGLVTPNPMIIEALIGFTVALVAIENISSASGNSLKIAIVCAIFLGLLASIKLMTGVGPPLIILIGLTLFTYCFLRLSDSPEKARSMRPFITTSFGLIHGFGFANVLMEVGLPEQRIIPALLGFNLGVELGQIAIVTGLVMSGWLLNKGLGRHENYQSVLTDCLSAGLCGLGVFWFVQRAYF